MKSIYIRDLRDGESFHDEPFVLIEVTRRETRDDRPFLLCTFGDSSGHVRGVFWDVPAEVEGWAVPGTVAFVTGHVSRFKDNLQITATDMMPAGGEEIDGLVPTSGRPAEQMVQELRDTIAELGQPWRRLLEATLLEPATLKLFSTSPAAKMMHHAYIGGLLEHTLSMAAVAGLMARHYGHVDRDLLISGVLLHDLGKIRSYSIDPSFQMTSDGRLVGHIVDGIMMVERAAEQLGDIPRANLSDLVHLIASHHGTQEWGSPVVPQTLEAVLLHQIDLLDSRIQGYLDHVNSDVTTGEWTGRSVMFSAQLRRPTVE